MSSRLKFEAKSIMAKSQPGILAVTLLYVIVVAVLSYCTATLTGFNLTESQLEKYMDIVRSGDYEKAIQYLMKFAPELMDVLIALLVTAVKFILEGGLAIFLLKSVRNTGDACRGNLLDGFTIPLRIIAVKFVSWIIIIAGFVLFYAPGIIMFYCYRQALYLQVDNPDWSPVRCLSESRKMMRGKKMDLFRLDMSFIGWYLLSALPGVNIWVTPFTQTTYTLFYLYLLAEKSRENMQQTNFPNYPYY